MEINLENFVTDEMISEGEYKIINLKGVNLCVFKNGVIYKWLNKNRFRIIPNSDNHKGYNKISLKKKNVMRHRIICYTFKNLDIDNIKSHVDHINGDGLDNNINNLRIVNNQQNHFN